jgi:galactokinase/mevalonate kinase-like predicted kinase
MIPPDNTVYNVAMIIATAPGRCGLLGNPTDMYGGSVISCSLQERARCEIRESKTLILEADNGEQETISDVSQFAPTGNRLDLAKAVLKGMDIDPQEHTFYLKYGTEVPMQAGLSGSTALFAATYGAIAKQIGFVQHKHAIAESIRKIEYEILGVICGFQDQHMAVFGGLNYMDFRDKGSHIDADEQPLATIEPLAEFVQPLPMILAHTGVKHHSGQAHKPVRQRWLEGNREVIECYERVAKLARFGKDALLRGDWERVAEMMNENQAVQKQLGASGKAVDDLVEVALANGAIAAKLAGAGQGGTILAMTFDPEKTIAALKAAGAGRIMVPKPSAGLTVEEVS